jgi:hypothetical protein
MVAQLLIFILVIFNFSYAQTSNKNLQQLINQFIQSQNIPKNCSVAISASIFDDKETILEEGHFQQHKLFYVASISKLLILLAVMEEVKLGKIELDQPVKSYLPKEQITTNLTVRESLEFMIRESSNFYAGVSQRLLSGDGNLGKTKTATIIKKYGFEKGIFWVGKGYENGASYPGVRYNHEATAQAISNFYQLLLEGKLPLKEEMLEILSESKIKNRFFAEINKIIPAENIYRKSGSWTGLGVYSDSVMASHNGINFILVMLIQGLNCTTTEHYKTWHAKLAKMTLDYIF